MIGNPSKTKDITTNDHVTSLDNVVIFVLRFNLAALRLPGIPPAVGTLQTGRTPVFSLDLKPRQDHVSSNSPMV
ncbi:hypothetical protein FC99_GL000934 [Levilactobacillus koreensis JCM 16448]|nr:hypothetical protein FC99_GL000934 [Levilactobacillus koreensis JCM 16448]